jgi:hypothetical protein
MSAQTSAPQHLGADAKEEGPGELRQKPEFKSSSLLFETLCQCDPVVKRVKANGAGDKSDAWTEACVPTFCVHCGPALAHNYAKKLYKNVSPKLTLSMQREKRAALGRSHSRSPGKSPQGTPLGSPGSMASPAVS